MPAPSRVVSVIALACVLSFLAGGLATAWFILLLALARATEAPK